MLRLAHYGFLMLLVLASAGTAAAQGRGRGGGPAGAPARTGPGPAMSRNSAPPAARPPAMTAPPVSNRPNTGQINRVPDRHVILDTPPYMGLYGGYYPGLYNRFYNGYYNGFYDPYSYVSAPPYYPSAPYASSYVEQSFVAPSPSTSELQLSHQVERLTQEVERLRQDQAEAALRQALAPPPPRVPEPPPIPITLVFRDGRRLSIQSYAISRQTLWVVDERMSMKVDLKDLDLPATQQANLGRVLLFPVPAQ